MPLNRNNVIRIRLFLHSKGCLSAYLSKEDDAITPSLSDATPPLKAKKTKLFIPSKP